MICTNRLLYLRAAQHILCNRNEFKVRNSDILCMDLPRAKSIFPGHSPSHPELDKHIATSPLVVPNGNTRAIVQVDVPHDRGTRAVVLDLVNLDKLTLGIAEGEVVLAESRRHDGVGAAAGASRRPLEGHAGDGARLRVQIPSGYKAWVSIGGAGRGVEVLGGRCVSARNHDFGGGVV